jgi:hypothetical protein
MEANNIFGGKTIFRHSFIEKILNNKILRNRLSRPHPLLI